MSSNGVPQNPTAQNVAALLPKLQDADSDIRYMTLNDLNQMLINGHSTFLLHDQSTSGKVIDGLLRTLTDSHGEVQNMAIKCLGPFVNKAPESAIVPTIDRISMIKIDNNLDTSIPALAIRAIVVALPHPLHGLPKTQKIVESYGAISKSLIPRLIGREVVAGAKRPLSLSKGMLEADIETGHDSNSLDILIEVAKYFGPMLQEAEVDALAQMTMLVLDNERCGSVMKKKAIAALSALSIHFNDGLLAAHVSRSIEKLRNPHLISQQRKVYIAAFGSLSCSIPSTFGPYLKTLAPFVLAPLSQAELEQQREAEIEADGERDVQMEEVREAALAALENFLDTCAPEMNAYKNDILDAALRFLKYDPNLAEDDDEEMEEDEAEDELEVDEDFEEETGFEDEDDVSWKVRKCSAKALHALISTLDSTDPAIYDRIAPALISRFTEPEESVRTEVIATLSFLIKKAGSNYTLQPSSNPSTDSFSRKRRRTFSESLDSDLRYRRATMNADSTPSAIPDGIPTGGKDLSNINPEVITGASKLLKGSTLPTKQAVVTLLKDMALTKKAFLADRASLVIDPIIEVMNSKLSSGPSASSTALQQESLSLLRVILSSHPSKLLQSHFRDISLVLIPAAKDRYAKVSSEAISTIEALIDAMTPPRTTAGDSQTNDTIFQLYQVLTERISAQDTDTEVRQKALQTLGFSIGRTSSTGNNSSLSPDARFAGQQLISDRLQNELTRLACVRAVDSMLLLAKHEQDFKPGFVSSIALELGEQLRKASRSLRGASLSALRTLAINPASRTGLNHGVLQSLKTMLVPLLTTEDLHMMGPALIVLAALVVHHPQMVVTPDVVNGISSVAVSPLAGAAMESLATCVEAIGKSGQGKELMSSLLKIADQGDADVFGQLIGVLLIAGGNSTGVTVDAFLKELENHTEETKQCLALSVLGEAGLAAAKNSGLKPEHFTKHFQAKSEKVKLAAAVAFGRASAGNVREYVPRMLDEMAGKEQYLLLHSVKELLQHSNAEDEIRPYTKVLWENVISSGQVEDNKVMGAECVGRLAMVDPAAYLPQLQIFLKDKSPTIRGMVIQALRYVCSETNEGYNSNLRNSLVPMLATMLEDRDLENQRLALATFHSALHNKPDLVLPRLPDLLPLAIRATVIRPELVREVAMGPFKHKIDDGLEIRKAAYETLYALLDTPALQQRLDIPAYYDRIVAGISDEHEIKILCCLVLGKLLVISPSESSRRLDSLAQQFRTVLSFKPKETAVKQELEKIADHSKAIVKVSVAFNRTFASETSGDVRAWRDYYDFCNKTFPTFVKSAEDELRGVETK